MTKEGVFIFLVALAIIIGPAYNTYLDFNIYSCPDPTTYINIANGNFKDQSLTRRYRVIVPFMAKVVSCPFELVYQKLWPHRSDIEWPIRMGFFLVNTFLVALCGLGIFYVCRAYGASRFSSLMGMIAVLCSRWANYIAATPLTDSLYLLVIIATMLGIKRKSYALQIFALFVGPFSKEAFIFIAPILFFFGSIPKGKQVILFLISGLLVVGERIWIDSIAGSASISSIQNNLAYLQNIQDSLIRIFSIRGIGELFTVIGIFSFIIIIGLYGNRKGYTQWTKHLDGACIALIASVIFQSLISIEVSRMLFFCAPVWAVIVSLVLDKHPLFKNIPHVFYNG